MTISNGYILPMMSFDQLQKLCLNLRKELEPIQKQLFAEKFAYLCASIIDQNQFGVASNFFNTIDREMLRYEKHSRSFLPYTEIMSVFMNYQKNEDRAPGYNFKLDITFSPLKNKILAQAFAPMLDQYEHFLFSFPEFESYNYWDKRLAGISSTQRLPTGITDKEWNVRKKDWSKIMANGDIKSSGFSFNILNNDTLIESDLVIKYQPSVEFRAQSLIIDIIYQEEIKLIQVEDPSYMGEISLFLKIKSRIANGELPVESRVADLAKQIKPLTTDVLTSIHTVNPFLMLVDR